MECLKHAALDLGDVLQEIQTPDFGSVLDVSKMAVRPKETVDLFAEKKRKGWDKTVEARCDFSRHPGMVRRSGLFFLSLWRKTLFGRTLTDIKGDDSMVDFFADNLSALIADVLGQQLSKGDWCIITTPKRRHLVKNFATRISEAIASRLGIPFYEDVCSCRTKQRVNAVFTVNCVPKEQNVIVFDDFVTTGQTLQAMLRALEPYQKNLFNVVGINNKL